MATNIADHTDIKFSTEVLEQADMFKKWLQKQPDTEFNRLGIATLDSLISGKEETTVILECILEDAEDTDENLQYRNLLEDLKSAYQIGW